jgi:putative endonuclease
VTNDIARRAYEHRQGLEDGFTRRYRVHLLVHYEPHATARDAIQREKTLKHWVRAWKVALIEEQNLDWRDLYDDLLA